MEVPIMPMHGDLLNYHTSAPMEAFGEKTNNNPKKGTIQ